MPNDFKSGLKNAAEQLGLRVEESSVKSEEVLPDSINNEQPANIESKQEIKLGSHVLIKDLKDVHLCKLPGGTSAGIGMNARMGYKDTDSGFLVVSFEPDGINKTVEIKPVRYTYKTDEGTTYFTRVENLTVTPETTTQSF